MIFGGPWSGPSIRSFVSRPFMPRQQRPRVHVPATWKGRRAGWLRVVDDRAARTGAPRWCGTFRPRLRENSDLPRKLASQRTALRIQDSWQEQRNSDPSRKGIVTNRARSRAGHQGIPVEYLVELPNPARVSPAKRRIHAGHCRAGAWSRSGCGQYRPPTQAIVTPPASNSDLPRKGIVTPHAGNSDLPRKGIVTSRARNSDLSRKRSSSIACKTAYFPSLNPTSLLYVCMFNVPVVYRKGGRGWS